MSYKKHHFNTQYSTTGVYAKPTCITRNEYYQSEKVTNGYFHRQLWSLVKKMNKQQNNTHKALSAENLRQQLDTADFIKTKLYM